MIRKATLEGTLHGISICRRAPQLSHLFFVDNSLLFCHANIEECEELMQILHVYESSTSQQLNREKTSLFFSRNKPLETKERIQHCLGRKSLKQHKKYLGLPSLMGRSKRNTYPMQVGRKNSYPMQVRKYLLKLWHKLFQHTL